MAFVKSVLFMALSLLFRHKSFLEKDLFGIKSN